MPVVSDSRADTGESVSTLYSGYVGQEQELTDHSKTSILNHDLSTASFQDLDKKAVGILAALRTGEDRQLELLVRSSESQKLLDDQISGLQDTIQTSTDHLDSRFDDLVQKIANNNQPDVKKGFMDSLFFPEFRYRQDNVSEPWTKTFEWFL